ncbi:hypothetical protein B9479_001470 [Cryptococcus floricola]|uniref:NADH dehydrogenase [ubiquinone] 1 alpha subcomplex assembly factor 3 n=1 Tax=Cryptococcus floricola TaxID=2591691 RepID=A0A5D3B6M7_9TREE|nr:hypothetical protein B9479_001470 [Cryptococcus floricola]
MASILRHAALPLRCPSRVASLSVSRPNAAQTRRHFQNILAPQDPEADTPTITISKLTDRGLICSDNLVIPGGAIFHSGKVIMWDVDAPSPRELKPGERNTIEKVWEGWESDRFTAFEMLVPRPEILLLGTGTRAWPAPKRIRDYISSLGIQLDTMDSRNAASTYNLLIEEGRRVSAALCPQTPIDPRTGAAR